MRGERSNPLELHADRCAGRSAGDEAVYQSGKAALRAALQLPPPDGHGQGRSIAVAARRGGDACG